MKTSSYFNPFKFLALALFISIYSCQQETIDISQPNANETLKANSSLTTLISRTSTNDGSKDNIIDRANCLEVKLPVTVVVNNIEIIIDSEEDFDTIEEIFEEFDNDIDQLNIQFPVTIISSDFTETVINNEAELEELISSCVGENQDDDDIECIDFKYPISISIFNTSFDVIETKTINNDKELFRFIKNLDDNVLASLNFPVAMVLADGSTVVVNNNQELERVINEAKDSCDEDDDYDYDDDDNDCDITSVKRNLKECIWEIKRHSTNTDLVAYRFKFKDDFTFKAFNSNGVEKGSGTWTVEETSNGALAVKFETNATNAVESFIGEWKILECGDNFLELDRGNSDIMKIKKKCPDVRVGAFKEVITECNWLISYLEVNGENVQENYAEYVFNFNEDGTFVAKDGTTEHEGTWVTQEVATGGIAVSLSSSTLTNDINDYYLLTRLDEDIVHLQGEQNHLLKFKRSCPNDGDINVNRVKDIVTAVDVWKIKYLEVDGVDKTSEYNTVFLFKEDGTIVAEGNGENYTGTWEAEQLADGSVKFTIVSDNLPNNHIGNFTVTYVNNEKIYLKGSNNNILKLEKES
ncbi:hypothetical protein [Tenacibaculum amylolyticum]|uniref:hypothetical protein n=1 Tax=Tenacibaculum amylolyticum TaxID=104269 RepID=UPI00389443DA